MFVRDLDDRDGFRDKFEAGDVEGGGAVFDGVLTEEVAEHEGQGDGAEDEDFVDGVHGTGVTSGGGPSQMVSRWMPRWCCHAVPC